MIDIVIPKVRIDKYPYIVTLFLPESIKTLIKIEKHKNIDFRQLFQEKGNIFIINCHNIL